MDFRLESSGRRNRERSGWRRPDPVPERLGAGGINAAASRKCIRSRSGAGKGLRPKGLSYSGTFGRTGLKTRHYRGHYRSEDRGKASRIRGTRGAGGASPAPTVVGRA
jgi:hypothetical protein